MNVLRSSLRFEASPGALPMSSTEAPSSSKYAVADADPSPLITSAVRAPLAGTEPTTATSANEAPAAVTTWATCALISAAAAFMSAKQTPSDRWGAASVAARTATFALVRLSTRSAPRTASATASKRSTPAGVAVSAGSKPVTSQPFARNPDE